MLPLGEPEIDTLKLFDDLFLLAVPAGDSRPADQRISAMDIDQSKLILLEDGHCLRDQALAFCATAARGNSPGANFKSSETSVRLRPKWSTPSH